jgi:hypothetical protein
MARNTRTGQVLEMMVLPALEMGGYFVEKQVRLGERLGGGKHYADILATKGDESIVVSLKWQQSSGTAEQKVPYEYMCLANTVNLHEDVAQRLHCHWWRWMDKAQFLSWRTQRLGE